jgi:hypothetical protein
MEEGGASVEGKLSQQESFASLSPVAADGERSAGARSARRCCVDLSPRPLPRELGDGVWGTARLVAALDRLHAACGGRNSGGEDEDSDGGQERGDSDAEGEPEKGKGNGEGEDGKSARPPLRGACGGRQEARGWAVGLYSLGAFGLFIYLLWLDWNATTELGAPVAFSSGYVFERPVKSCGIEAASCRPFATSEWTVARCERFSKVDYQVIGGGGSDGMVYRSDSRICSAAIHAGLVGNWAGGCFAYRFVGERASFTGELRNGVHSNSSEWHPKAVELRAVQSQHCTGVQPATDAYAFAIFAVLVLILRPSKMQALAFLITEGFLYLVSYWRFSLGYASEQFDHLFDDSLIYMLNELFGSLVFVLLPTAYVLYFKTVKCTMPSVRKYPLDLLLFYWIPFWAGLKVHFIEEIGLDASLTESAFATPAKVLGLLLFVGLFFPVFIAQCLIHWRAGQLGLVLRRLAAFIAAAVAIMLLAGDYVSLHVHHYFLGLVAACFFQGQPRWRFSVIAQAAMLGLWVNGIVIWQADPFFDKPAPVKPTPPPTPRPTPGPTVPPPRVPVLYWTDVVAAPGGGLLVQWAHETVVLGDWQCNVSGSSNSSLPVTTGRRQLLSDDAQRAIDALNAREQHRRSLDTLVELPTPNPTPSPGPTTVLSLNNVSLINGFLAPLDGVYNISRSGMMLDANFTLRLALDGTRPEKPLKVSLNDTFTGSFFAVITDRCSRVLAIRAMLAATGIVR